MLNYFRGVESIVIRHSPLTPSRTPNPTVIPHSDFRIPHGALTP